MNFTALPRSQGYRGDEEGRHASGNVQEAQDLVNSIHDEVIYIPKLRWYLPLGDEKPTGRLRESVKRIKERKNRKWRTI